MSVITGGTIIEGGPPQELSGSAAPVNGTDEIQTVTIGGTPEVASTFKLTYDGWTTSAITWSGTTGTLIANVDAALEALPNIAASEVTTADVNLSSGTGTFTVTFVNGLGKLNVPLMTGGSFLQSTGAASTGTISVATTTPGVDATGRGAPTGTRYNRTSNGVDYINTGTALAPTWTTVDVTLAAALLTAVAGTVSASKALIVGTDKNLDVLAVADLKLGSAAGTSVTATAAQINAQVAVPSTFAVVATTGNDSTGKGSFAFPYLTIAKAVSVWTATRHTIYVLAGEYSEVALVWPDVKDLQLVALGDVTITNSDAAASVLTIAPTYTASTFGATVKGAINLAGTGAQIGLKIANAAMTKKLNVYLDGLTAEVGTSGDSIDIAGTVSGQAIRVYAKNLNLEGLLHFTANDAGSRLRIQNSELVGGITVAGAVAAEATLQNCQVLASGVTKDGAWAWSAIGCVYATDADPAVYTDFANVYDT